jgi:urease accessory protein
MSWLVWQLADSAFPVGGFAHSGGLESAVQHGEVTSLEALHRFVREALWQSGQGALPLVGAACAEPGRLPELDALTESFLTGEVGNRASRTQGRALLSTCERALPSPALDQIAAQVRSRRLRMHHAPLWGAILATLGIAKEEAQRLYLHLSLRGLLSAAIRLGILGPQQAQHLHFQLSPALEEVYRRCRDLAAEEIAQTAPLIELFQSAHDRLYSRLFLS